MDLLHVANSSTDSAIVAAALRLAEERQRLHAKSEAKISPTTAAILGTFVGVAGVAACWYVLVKHPDKVGFARAGLIGSFAVLLICSYALFSGHLSQTNFMTVVRAVLDRIKKLSSFGKK